MRLRAPWPEAPVAGLRWGSLLLEEDGTERQRQNPPPQPRRQPSNSMATASDASSGGTKWPPGNSR